ncbi:hypothetical protein [Xanthobacter wiegelii]
MRDSYSRPNHVDGRDKPGHDDGDGIRPAGDDGPEGGMTAV